MTMAGSNRRNGELAPGESSPGHRGGDPRRAGGEIRYPWPRHGRPAEHPSSHQYLLDLDDDLADEFDVRMRLVARAAVTAVTFELEAGAIDLTEWLERAAPGPGVLAIDGVLAAHVRVGDRIAAELLGGGDLVTAVGSGDDDLLACEVAWRALTPVRLAVLDAGFAERAAPWPQINQALLRRTARRAGHLNVQRAISAQPRLEVRLALLFWHFAARWGKVEPGGIRLPLPLTHQLLGRLVGAERPSVSHALARLAASRLVTGHGDEWHLHGNLGDRLATMIEAADDRAERLVAAVVALRPR
jgi:CRP/FNR family transcriptional regulator, cyclic AMP receptor protein